MNEAKEFDDRSDPRIRKAISHNILPEGKFGELMDQLPVGLYWDLPGSEGHFLAVNRTLAEMFGYESKEEFLGVNAVDLYVDSNERTKFSRQLLDEGVLQGIELQLKKKDGTTIWCRENSHVVLDEQGEVICFHGVIEDITPLKKRHERLEAIHDLVATVSGAMKVDWLLSTFIDRTRKLLEADIGVLARIDSKSKTIEAIISVGSNPPTAFEPRPLPDGGPLVKLANGGEICTGDISTQSNCPVFHEWCPGVRACMGVPVLYHGDLEAMIILGQIGPGRVFTDEDLGTLRILANLAAISIHSAEQFSSLVRASNMSQRILETAATAVFTVNPDKTIRSVNKAFCDVTGYRPQEVVGRPCTILDDHHLTGESRFLGNGNDSDFRIMKKECTIRRRDGKRITVLKNAALLSDEDGSSVGAVQSFIDVTELIEQRQVAVDASMAKSGFLANMSHEIRTPLNGIIGMTELVLDMDPESEQRGYLETVKSCADSLLILVNDILDLSKIEACRLDLEEIDFDLGVVMEDVLDMMAHRANGKSLELIGHLDEELPRGFKGDPTRLRQIMINLVGNAIKFTEKGEVVLRIELDGDRESGERFPVRISVTDTGIGISDEQLNHIFEPFTQAEESTTREFGGTGLGLAISRQLVELMGGSLLVESRPGHGTCFNFTIPLKEGIPAKRTESADVPAVNLTGRRVLIVDDNETNRLMLRQMLETWGCDVCEAADGDSALEQLDSRGSGDRCELVLLDLQMPGKDGFETARAIREFEGTPQPRIVLMTSPGAQNDSRRCREIGIDGYFVKPIKRSLMKKALAQVMDRAKDASSESGGSDDLVTRFSIKDDRSTAPARILLTEDNAVNQRLAMRILEKAGYEVLIALNGLEALDVLEKERVDLVLMDIQMPEMDGLEATREIRGRSEWNGIPIVAMTAHAMAGDRERCLSAGMDDYLTKPIRKELVLDTVKQWLEESSGSMEPPEQSVTETEPELDLKPAEPEKPAPGKTPIDIEEALSRVEGDREFLRELLQDFMNDVPERLKLIDQAVEAGKGDELERLAHNIKGAAASMSAEGLRFLAFELEQKGEQGDLQDVQPTVDRFHEEFDRLTRYLTGAGYLASAGNDENPGPQAFSGDH